MENQNDPMANFRQFVADGKIVIGIFVAGVSLALWGMSQISSIEGKIALIQADISNINTNHEAHIQDILQNMKDLQLDQKAEDATNQQQSSDIRQILFVLNQKYGVTVK